jgi:hypothetical protein
MASEKWNSNSTALVYNAFWCFALPEFQTGKLCLYLKSEQP